LFVGWWGGNFGFGGGNFGFGGGNFGFGGGNFGFGGGEINLQTANSVTRPPRNLTATALSGPRSIRLNWTVPTFGQIGAYNIYRGVDAVPVAPPYATVSGSPLPTPFTDTKVSCGHTYTYFVTAVLAGTNSSQESVPSTSVSVINCTK